MQKLRARSVSYVSLPGLTERLTVFCVLANALVMNPCMGVSKIIIATPASDDKPVVRCKTKSEDERERWSSIQLT